MVTRDRRNTAGSSIRLAVRLHDVSGDLAIGIALLKGWTESGWSETPGPPRPLEVLEQVLAELRQLTRAFSDRAASLHRPLSVRESLERVAQTAGVDLELQVTGHDGWLAPQQAELISLVGREAIRNVKRHSGGRRCRITIEVSGCPYVLVARDWGAGIQKEARGAGGITMLQELARDVGAVVSISSLPGLGAELVLTGPRCMVSRTADQSDLQEDHLRSVVADESPGSRKRVATRRPIAPFGQQIT
jgi:hypothetical protein